MKLRLSRKCKYQWILCAALATLSGCGGSSSLSQADLKKYGISRSDSDEEEEQIQEQTAPATAAPAEATEDDAATVTSQAAATPTPTSPTSTQPSEHTASSTASLERPAAPIDAAETGGDTSAQQASNTINGLLPIAERRPAEPLSSDQRRERAIQNLDSVTTAVHSWAEQSGYLDTSAIRNSKGRAVLSWRVKLLPLLGYQELYQQFNLERSWDSPENKRLLPYIPEEFVSPERFDEFTNIQLFSGGSAAFSEGRRLDRNEITDSNVLVLVETDDQAAVPWTAPADYSAESESLSAGIGNLREDGAFVGWLDGTISVWVKPLKDTELLAALTYDKGDQFNIARHAGYPKRQLGGPNFGPPANVTADSENTTEPPPNAASLSANTPSVETVVQYPLPSREEILASEQKVRSTYKDQFTAARTAPELARLADQIVKQLTEGNSPPADLYVGLRTALNIAVQARDPNLALGIVDQLAVRFDVKRVDFQALMIEGFLGDKGTLRTEVSKAVVLLPLIEQLILSAVLADDFDAAENFVKLTNLLVRNTSDRETAYRWRILRQRVEEGKRLLPRVAKHMQTLAEEPDNQAANEAIGWYLCMIKNEWQPGMQHLAKSKDVELRELAQLELQVDSSPVSHVRLADAWWNYAESKEQDALAFEGALQRARTWYLSAATGLPDGLDRIRANNRLSNIDRLIGALPDRTAVPQRSL